MRAEQCLEELKTLAEQLGVVVRFEIGNFSGGYCILHEKKLIVINKKIPVETKAALLAQSLYHFPLEGIYLKPVLREYIEDQHYRMARARTALQPAKSA